MTPVRAPFIVLEGLDRSGKSTQAAKLEARLRAEYPGGVRLMKFPDRTTPIGKMIDAYLRSESEMDDRAIHLLFSANRWEAASTIENLLNAGTAVIADRYAFSGIAFTLSKPSICPPPPNPASSTTPSASFEPSSTSPTPDPTTTPAFPTTPTSTSLSAFPTFSQAYKWCQTPDISLPSPDLTIFLDVSPEVARSRAAYGAERYEKEELQRRVRETFGYIARDGRVGRDGCGAEDGRGAEDGCGAKDGHIAKDAGMKWVVVDAGKDLESVEREVWAAVESGVLKRELGEVGRLWVEKL